MSAPPTDRPRAPHPVAAVVVGLLLLFTFTAVFVTAFHAPRPDGADVGVVGPPGSAATVQEGLDRVSKGGFDVRSYASAAAARRGLDDGDVRGALLLDRHRATALMAGVYGPASATVLGNALQGAARAGGRSARIVVYRPLPKHDAMGLSPLFAMFGTALPSLVLGAVLALVGRALPVGVRWAVIVAFAALAGVVVALSVDTTVGALTGHFWGVAGVASLLGLAVASLSFGLGRLAGPLGIASAIVVVVLLGQSSTGGALTDELQPGFYHAISQLLPNGAALTALRNTVYLDGAHTAIPLLVLCGWATAGVCIGLLGNRLHRVPAQA